MSQLVIPLLDDRSDDGPSMSCLTDMEHTFIVAMVTTGAGPRCVSQAAMAAGYSGEAAGWRLMRKPKILAALREEANKRLLSGALIGSTVLIEIAMNSQHKDQFKAAKELLAHSGFIAEQKITVEHTTKDQTEMIAQITAMAKKLNLDPVALLGSAGVVITDAEFAPVDPGEEWSVGG